ncbi:Indolepyruvate oxidoreductase subunit IorA [hydrothermal vent metagenome]|uniref:Indolepyruvate oxidoreductase subunit IorA n=1 Tax=hydrothermal vent metagenome TaxID=652676 RepID=A0A3B0T174_9ZZZZ
MSSKAEQASPTAIKTGVTHQMTGNEAFARAAWEAGVKVASAYPGTPSTEIMENMAHYPVGDIKAQWATNEKVALDVAIGGSFAGVRSITMMKHVGLNVASDALMSQSYIGAHGGLVLIVCDDPGIHSSQNEQDTRLFGQFAQVPVLEPCDAQEALDFTKIAFDISERYDTPVIVRSTTRICHTRSPVLVSPRVVPDDLGFEENVTKNVMVPGHARARHPFVIDRLARFAEELETSDLNRLEMGSSKVGIITACMSYVYVKENLPDASVLKLGTSFPLPKKLIQDFCAKHDRVIVVEELEPVIENTIKSWGLKVEGKEFFPRLGELSPEQVRISFEQAGVLEVEENAQGPNFEPLIRPPVLCAGCPHAMSYTAIRSLDVRVAGDIGCYTLAVGDPLTAIDTTVAMGSSIANAVGMYLAGSEEKPIVATLGDSTFIHSGIPPLIDAVYNNANITVILLDNHITAMTGGQENPSTGKTLHGEQTHKVDFEDMIRACGVEWIERVDSYDAATMMQTMREAIAYRGVSVLIADRPCVLDPVKIKGPTLTVDAKDCNACQGCMNLGCPALIWSDEWYEGRHIVKIDPTACIGCSVCAQFCPTGAIQPTVVPDRQAQKAKSCEGA